MIYSKVSGDITKGTTNMPDGTIKYNVIGCYVMTTEEAIKVMENSKVKG